MIRLPGKVSGSLSHRLLLGRSFRIIIVNQRTHRAIIRAAPTGVPAAQVERDDIARRRFTDIGGNIANVESKLTNVLPQFSV